MSVNKYICTGRLTKDPEFRQISDETTVCDLRVAIDGMGRGRETGFIDVRVFGPAGRAAADHLTKGWLVAVDGRLEFSEWETDAGSRRHDYTVVGNVEFLAAPRYSPGPVTTATPTATDQPGTLDLTPGQRILLS